MAKVTKLKVPESLKQNVRHVQEMLNGPLADYIKNSVPQFIVEEDGKQQQTPESEVEKQGDATEQDEHQKKGTRIPNEHDRIRTTLVTWAKKSGKDTNYGKAAEKLGIDPDTRRNHERDGWLYTEEEMVKRGGYESLWETYTTQYRKS